jgi:hypothetical protein
MRCTRPTMSAGHSFSAGRRSHRKCSSRPNILLEHCLDARTSVACPPTRLSQSPHRRQSCRIVGGSLRIDVFRDVRSRRSPSSCWASPSRTRNSDDTCLTHAPYLLVNHSNRPRSIEGHRSNRYRRRYTLVKPARGDLTTPFAPNRLGLTTRLAPTRLVDPAPLYLTTPTDDTASSTSSRHRSTRTALKVRQRIYFIRRHFLFIARRRRNGSHFAY